MDEPEQPQEEKGIPDKVATYTSNQLNNSDFPDDNNTIEIVGGGENKATLNIPPSTLSLPKSSLGDIEEENEGEVEQKADVENKGTNGNEYPLNERASSALPKSRTGNGSRGRWNNDSARSRGDGLPNSSSTNLSPTRGLDDYEHPDNWSISRGFNSPLSSPAFTPSLGQSPEPGRKSRIQVKDHGPVAKWLAKRQKKKEEEAPVKQRSVSRGQKKYAPHIQPKVNTRNNDYQPSGGDLPPVKTEKLTWNAKPLVQTHNDWYKLAASSENKSPPPVLNEKLQWDAQTKVDMWNRDYKPSVPKKFQVFSEKLQWYEQPKVNTSNPGYVPPTTQQVPVVDEEIQWKAKSKVDTHNTTYRPAKSSNVTVFHQSPQWKAHAKVETTRPHYMSGGGNIRVKTDKLVWSSEAKVNTFNPSYVHTHGNQHDRGGKLDVDKAQKENNGWSSHSSDSETEWYSSLPGSEQVSEKKFVTKAQKSSSNNFKPDVHMYEGEPTDRAIIWHPRKLLFNSKDLVDNAPQTTTSRSYPIYKSVDSKESFSGAKKVPPIRSFSRFSGRDSDSTVKKSINKDKPRKVFKEMKAPLPPVGTYTHRANEPVVYPTNRSYIGHRGSRPQKIEVIDMEDLTLLNRRARHTVFIN